MIPQFLCRFSWNALLCLLAVAALLLMTARAAAKPADKLQSLVNDTAAQIELAYRQNPTEGERRRAELVVVLAGWRAAERSEANNERLATWLRAAIRKSMPGVNEPLPAVPAFAATIKNELLPAGKSVLKKKTPEPTTKSEADPFQDDPAGKRG